MMHSDLREEYINLFCDSLQPPYYGGMKQWCEDHVVLPPVYAIPGELNLDLSPYLHKPMEDIDDPMVRQINLCMATQIGKSLIQEIAIPYLMVNKPGPMMRIFHTNDASELKAETHVIPLLKMCEETKMMLDCNKNSIKKDLIKLPHCHIQMLGATELKSHGGTTKYLFTDENHKWETGMFEKYVARTTAFSGRRKIVCSSQPNQNGSDWYNTCHSGKVYQWQWLCPKCNTRQPFVWSKKKADGESYCGMNWTTILNKSGGETNIDLTSNTGYIECEKCDHHVHDTPEERQWLLHKSEYVCIKHDGDPAVHTYMCPCYVNVSMTFKEIITAYHMAVKDDFFGGNLMETFTTQMMGEFYKQRVGADTSVILTEVYEKTLDKDWLPILTVDVQRSGGGIKFWLVRAWKRDGTESKRIDFGVCRTWEEIEAIRLKHNIPLPLVGVDSGDGVTAHEVYQQCIIHGQVMTINNQLQYICWCPLKGDQKTSWTHGVGDNKIQRMYSPVSNMDAHFLTTHKLHKIPAPLILWSNYSVKSILMKLRDNKMPNYKWMIDHPDEQYDSHMYSEDIALVFDKKSKTMKKRWVQDSKKDNHYLDVEAMNLCMAIRAGVFSTGNVDEQEINQIIEDKIANENRTTTTVQNNG